MWATLALTTVLNVSTVQPAQIKLTNEKVTHGFFGWERKSPKIVPGDVYIITFDIENLTVKDDGKIQYSIGMEFTSKGGKKVFSQEPVPQDGTNSLGGTKVPASVVADVGTGTPPGEYSITATVTDLATKKSAVLTRSFEVVKTELAMVRVIVTYDHGLPAPPVAVPGQKLQVNFGIVGFGLDEKKKQPNLKTEMVILDEEGNPTVPKPFLGGTAMVPDEFKTLIPMSYSIYLNRTGKFRVNLKVTDVVTGKEARETLAFEVVEPR
jgi:hypothetical protein